MTAIQRAPNAHPGAKLGDGTGVQPMSISNGEIPEDQAAGPATGFLGSFHGPWPTAVGAIIPDPRNLGLH